ncbi:MAG: MFS transporter [Chloroflexi bacterium]|nr:MFS transporter [Chloroflexota bacterium]
MAVETAAPARRNGLFYGWWIVISGGVVQGYTSAVFWRGFQAFFDPIVLEFGWSRGATAGALSLQRTESGLISPFVGTLLDKFGPRTLMAFGVAVTGLGFVVMSLVNLLWQFYAAMALLTIGMSFGTFIVLVATVGNWFIRKRGRALAILMSCSAIGGFTLPILVGAIDNFGWRHVLFAVGIGFWIIGFPAVLTMRRRPEDYGMKPDGTAQVLRPQGARGRGWQRREPNIPTRRVLRMRFFWQFAVAASLGQLLSSTNLLHLPALKSYGVNPAIAALAAGSIAFGDLAGRLGMGLLGDRFDKRHVMAAAFALMTIGSLALTVVNARVFGISLGVAVPLPVFAIGFGLGFGASIPLRLTMIADYFGRRSYGSVMGVMSSVSAIFGAIGPIFVGAMFDVTESYRLAFLILSVLVALAVPMTWFLEDPDRVAARARLAVARQRRAHHVPPAPTS